MTQGRPTAGSSAPESDGVLAAPEPALRAVVVIPARDERQRIEACLLALAGQRDLDPDEFELIVVLDGCRDDTAEVARRTLERAPGLRVHTIELAEGQGVGRARRRGMNLACRRLWSLNRPQGLIASTDADSVVASDWLARQLALIERGAQAIGGHIELHVAEAAALPAPAIRERAGRASARLRAVTDARSSSGPVLPAEHHQFSGASLALTAEAYRRCGGLPARAALEDEALERALTDHGIPILRTRAVRVRTSARTDGRAPRGLARDLLRSSWRARRSYRADQFPLERLLAEKEATIALVLPAREVAATVGAIAERAVSLREAGLLDEVLVVDAGSLDGSARVAAEAGADVVQENDLYPELGPVRGKGDAMWRALGAVDSEIVAYADTDTEGFGGQFVTGLLGPLVCDPQVRFVKGFFRRPFRTDGAVLPHGGGRVTELMARPLLNLHASELAVFDQPLAGEVAARRDLLEQVPFAAGYGVEIAMLIDVWRLVGLDRLAQVDLGLRQNRHQPLRDLSAMAYAVLVAAESRFLGRDFADARAGGSLLLPPLDGESHMESRTVAIEERPPHRDYHPSPSWDAPDLVG